MFHESDMIVRHYGADKAQESRSSTRPSILAVSSTESFMQLLQITTGYPGPFKTATAENAIDTFYKREGGYDVLLVSAAISEDPKLHHVTGVDLAKAIRDRAPRIIIGLVTTALVSEVISEAQREACGISCVLEFPYTLDQAYLFLEKIEQAVIEAKKPQE